MPLTGCFDKTELEDQAFAPAIGIDKGPKGTIFVTARIDIPSKLASSGGAGGGGGGNPELGGAKPITVQARSLPEALTLLNTTVERRISLTHLSAIIFGQALASQGIATYLRTMTRYREFRSTVFVFVAKGTARNVFESDKPVLEKSVTRYIEDLQQVSRDLAITPVTHMHNLLVSMEAKTEDPIAPIIAVNPTVAKAAAGGKGKGGGSDQGGGDQGQGDGAEEGGTKQKGAPTGKKVSYKPGQISRSGGNPDETVGTAFFHSDRMVGVMDGEETRYLLMIRGEFTGCMMHFPDSVGKNHYVNLLLRKASQPDVNVDVRAHPVRIRIRLPLEAEIMGEEGATDFSDPKNVNGLERSISSQVQAQVSRLITHVLHDEQADPFQLFRFARGQFSTHSEMEQYNWHKQLKNADVHVEVVTKIRRIGTMLQPALT